MINSLKTTELQKVSTINSMHVTLINNNYKTHVIQTRVKIILEKFSCPV